MRPLGRALTGLRASARKDGADVSGLASVLELSFLSAAGDALATVCLAGSQFFSVPLGEARSRVALYLLTTMAPFAILAPVVGPILDRLHGRRVALGATMLIRAFLVWTLADKLNSLALYPIALGLLATSRAFGVARSAVVPRVVPESWPLVRANSRLSITTVLAGTLVAPIGFGIAHVVGYPWVLRACAVVFVIGTLSAFNLPSHVDRATGEERARGLGSATVAGGGRWRHALGEVPTALRAASAMRGLVGFLTIFLAFLLRQTGGDLTGLGALAAAASIGSAIGIFLGGRLSKQKPEALLVFGLILATAACIGAAIDYTTLTGLIAALLATMAASMGKLSLDAVIQRDVPESTRNSAFARSETALQLAWVLGGAVGLLPMAGQLGFSLAAVAIAGALVSEFIALGRVRRRRRVAPSRTSTTASAELPAR
jgi:MFS family permease